MRITIINQFYVPDISPTAHLSASLAEHLAEAGHDVTVVTSKGGYTKDASNAAGAGTAGGKVSVERVWTPQLGKGSIVKRLTDYAFFYLSTFLTTTFLRRQDVIISLTTPPFIAWAGVVHTWLHRKCKLILWNMDCYPEAPERADMIPTDGFISRVLQFFNRALFRRIDHLIGLDTAMVDLLMGRYAPKKRALPTTIIPNFEDASFFPLDAEHEPWEGVERLGLADKFVVLYLGNMGVGHDFDTALDAAELLADDSTIRFLYIGGGVRKDPVAAEAEKRGLTNVIVHSYVPKSETPAVMAAAACSLITLRDNMLGVMSPSKLHSNLAMRLPILYVGPETSNVDDAITNFGCGRRFAIGDAETLATSIRGLASDTSRHERMRIAARRAFDEAYNDRAVMPQFDRVIESVTA
ncbi:MAG: glycosyltransferase family 4 protein [Planctomycetota bacterium]